MNNLIFKTILKKASEKVFDLMRVVNNESIDIRQVQEDGISSILLKEIAELRHYCDIKIFSLGVKEKETGMDFDIWIGEEDKRYIRFCVQAKSLGNGKTINDIYYSLRKEGQCEHLISYAEGNTIEVKYEPIIRKIKNSHKAFPLYFLYQYLDLNQVSLGKYFGFLNDFEPKNVGITFTSAYNILTKESPYTFENIHKNILREPLRYKLELLDILAELQPDLALPLYCFAGITPTIAERLNEMESDQYSSLQLLLLLLPIPFGKRNILPVHKITSNEIIKQYNPNTNKERLFKHLIIINSNSPKV